MAALGFLSVSALLTLACQRVPLLAPSGSTITLTATTAALPFSGTTQIVAQVLEPAGTPPHSGTHIIFTTTLGTIQPSEVETDINGQAVVTFSAGTASGTATITAASGGANVGTSGGLKIAVGAAAVASVNVGANPGVVAAVGGTSTITATVSDANGNALANVPVTFATDAGSLSASLVGTDQNGRAQTTLSTNKTSKVTATAGVSATSGTSTTAAPTGSVTVNVNAASTITVGTPSPSAPVVGQSVTFSLTQAAGGSPIQKTVVDYGDGRSETLTGLPGVVSHSYGTTGTFVVRATATDTLGDTWSGASSVTVAAKPQPIVTITLPATPTPNTPATFIIAVTGLVAGATVQTVVWDFGDGSSVTLPGNATSIQHVYTAGGTYTVSATVTDSTGATGAASAVISVTVATKPIVTITPPTTPTANTPATFTIAVTGLAAGASVQSVTWNFGDGATVTLSGNALSAQHVYTAGGAYTVSATVTDSTGATGAASAVITVTAAAKPQPTVSLTLTTTNPTAGTDVAFTASVAPATGSGTVIQDVTIDFGEPGVAKTDLGAATGTIALHHVYTNTNTYTVVLTATDSNGGVGTAVTTVFVQVAPPLAVSINSSASIGASTTIETFTATVTGLGNSVVSSYLWSFGNGDADVSSTTNQITHPFAHPSGPWTVTVKVTTSTGATVSASTSITP